MTELVGARAPAVHIPGAGIDFASVGFVRLVEADQVGPSLSRAALPGIRLAAPERLLPVDSINVSVGDLLATMTVSSRGARLGRPMQVRHVDPDGRAVVLDDRSLPRSTSVDPSLSSAIGFGETATAWHVLAAFGISRCPRCQSAGEQLVYGMLAGAPPAGFVAAGCTVPWMAADFQCARCHAEWPSVASDNRFGSIDG
jgi:hypothetical protein